MSDFDPLGEALVVSGRKYHKRGYRQFKELPALSEEPYRAGCMGKWPSHTDFSRDNIQARD